MSRVLAFALLAFAAFDWPLPWLDRPGTAALGLGFAALALGAARTEARRSLPFGIPTKTVAVADEAQEVAAPGRPDWLDEARAMWFAEEESAASLAQRIGAYE